MNYYCLMAGAPDLNLSDAKPALSVEQFREQCEGELSKKDWALLADYFFLEQDCRNLATLLQNAEAELAVLGNHSKEELLELMQAARESEQPVPGFPAFVADIVRQWDLQHDKEGYFVQDAAVYAFMQNALANCKNDMLRQWHALCMNVSNVLTALLARRHGWEPAQSIMGQGTVQEMIRQHNSKDFNLSTELEYMPLLEKIAEQDDPVEKERMVDALKWTWLEDETFFTPFGIESVFAYLCRLSILQRWAQLDVETGRQCFEQIIENLRGEAKVPEEFKNK